MRILAITAEWAACFELKIEKTMAVDYDYDYNYDYNYG